MNERDGLELATGRGFSTQVARSSQEVLAAQRLRYRVFGEELGSKLPHGSLGVDRDRFDAWCDHLIVRETRSQEVVGTYRLLPAARTPRTGGFYSETEFDLCGLRRLGSRVLEVGRACVHPSHRTGAVLGLLWAGLARYIRQSGAQYVIGCGSVPIGVDPRGAASICREVLVSHASPEPWRVEPIRPFDLTAAEPDQQQPVPALLRGYFRMGAWVCGPPAWDVEFGTADLLLLLDVERMSSRFAERLFRAA